MDSGFTVTPPIRVMVCEDTDITRAAMVLGLSHIDGLTIVGEATHGQQVIESVAACQPDIVLMDIRLPVMDGIEATRQIKQQMPYTKVLMVSAMSDSDWVSRAMAAGADGFCSKSVHPKRLKEAILAVLSGCLWLE